MNRFLPGLLVWLLLCMNGCYYGQLASGQFKLLWRRQPIEAVTLDPVQPERTRALLRLVDSVRSFAIELGLRVEDQYTSYVEWPGDRVVTTLVRTRPGSLEAVPYWFPIVGELPYKGYFDQARAETEADRLRDEEGFDVCVSAISAYSTLGWLDDPVTSTMLAAGAANLVETLFHELVHATAFLPDEADFNESVAQFIGQQASIRFFERMNPRSNPALPDAAAIRALVEDRRAIAAVTQTFREDLLAIEGGSDQTERRRLAEARTRDALASLPLIALDAENVAVEARLSDACMALRGTYLTDLPRHAALLAELDGNLEAMIARLSLWAEDDRPLEQFFALEGDGDGPAR